MTTPADDRFDDPMTLDSDLRDLALAAAHAGSYAILRELRLGSVEVNSKAHAADFVTSADKAAEQAILRLIRAARPHDAILAEESGVHAGESGVRWLVDPLDGTMNFVHRRGDYAVSVGVERDGQVVAGRSSGPLTVSGRLREVERRSVGR